MPDEPLPPFDKEKLAKLKSQTMHSTKVVVLNGYLGETSPIYLEEDRKLVLKDGAPVVIDYLVKIYPLLNHEAHFKIRLGAIQDSEPAIPGLTTGPMRLTVNATSEIEFVQRMKAEDSFLGGAITTNNIFRTIGVNFGLIADSVILTKQGEPSCPPICPATGPTCP